MSIPSWVIPVATGVLAGGSAIMNNQGRRDAANQMEQLNQQNYQAYLAHREYQDALGQARAAGSGSGSNRGQIMQAIQERQKYFDQARGYLEPYSQAALEMLPQQQEVFRRKLGLLEAVAQRLGTAESLDRATGIPKNAYDIELEGYTPATNTNLRVPMSLMGGK